MLSETMPSGHFRLLGSSCAVCTLTKEIAAKVNDQPLCARRWAKARWSLSWTGPDSTSLASLPSLPRGATLAASQVVSHIPSEQLANIKCDTPFSVQSQMLCDTLYWHVHLSPPPAAGAARTCTGWRGRGLGRDGAVSALKGQVSGDPFDLPLPHSLIRPVQKTSPSGPWLFPRGPSPPHYHCSPRTQAHRNSALTTRTRTWHCRRHMMCLRRLL